MGILKILITTVILVCICLLGGLFFLYYASDVANNTNATGQYAQQAHFVINMNWLISLIMTNLGYVLAILVIIGLVIAAIGYMSYKWISG